jgi:hypothetical protein
MIRQQLILLFQYFFTDGSCAIIDLYIIQSWFKGT